ncbi:MAG: porin [Pararhodobacter sp.]|nr:porin [Pararhodobacter sp.]
MKKILLASAALALTAGMATAQGVTISGDARMGVQYNNAGWGGGLGNWRMESRTNLNFAASVQADHGLSFGAYWRVRQDNAWTRAPFGATATSGDFSGHRVWVEAAGLRLSFGNQAGAVEAMGVTSIGAFGYTGGTFQTWGGLYAGGTGLNLYDSFGPGAAQHVGVSYTMGDVRVGVSHVRGGSTEVAAQATFDAFTVAAGASNAAARFRTASATYNGGNWAANVIWSQFSGNNLVTLGARADLGGGQAAAYLGRHAGANVGGVSYRYGLGGGATIGGAVERTAAGANRAELGVVFSF